MIRDSVFVYIHYVEFFTIKWEYINNIINTIVICISIIFNKFTGVIDTEIRDTINIIVLQSQQSTIKYTAILENLIQTFLLEGLQRFEALGQIF